MENADQKVLELDKTKFRNNLDVSSLEVITDQNDELALQIAEDFAEGMLHLINLAKTRNIDTLVFLDASARPLAYMFGKLWKTFYPNQNVNIAHININRKMADTGIPNEKIETEKLVSSCTTLMDNKNVLIADDFSGKGDTIVFAGEKIQNTFPNIASISLHSVLKICPNWQNSTQSELQITNPERRNSSLILDVKMTPKFIHELDYLSSIVGSSTNKIPNEGRRFETDISPRMNI